MLGAFQASQEPQGASYDCGVREGALTFFFATARGLVGGVCNGRGMYTFSSVHTRPTSKTVPHLQDKTNHKEKTSNQGSLVAAEYRRRPTDERSTRRSEAASIFPETHSVRTRTYETSPHHGQPVVIITTPTTTAKITATTTVSRDAGLQWSPPSESQVRRRNLSFLHHFPASKTFLSLSRIPPYTTRRSRYRSLYDFPYNCMDEPVSRA